MIKLYPEYVEDANAYEILANAELTKGNKQAALDALTEYEKAGGESPRALKKLAELQEELGRCEGRGGYAGSAELYLSRG